MGTDRRSHDPVDAIRRRRFDRQLTAARLQPRHQVIGDRADHRRLIAKPIFERLGVGNRRFAIAEQGADLGTMAFGSPPRQVQRLVLRYWKVDLLGDLPHHLSINLRAADREPPALAEEQQQHGKAQPVDTALGRDQCVIGWRQCPPVGEVRSLNPHASCTRVGYSLPFGRAADVAQVADLARLQHDAVDHDAETLVLGLLAHRAASVRLTGHEALDAEASLGVGLDVR